MAPGESSTSGKYDFLRFTSLIIFSLTWHFIKKITWYLIPSIRISYQSSFAYIFSIESFKDNLTIFNFLTILFLWQHQEKKNLLQVRYHFLFQFFFWKGPILFYTKLSIFIFFFNFSSSINIFYRRQIFIFIFSVLYHSKII